MAKFFFYSKLVGYCIVQQQSTLQSLFSNWSRSFRTFISCSLHYFYSYYALTMWRLV